MEIRLGTPRYLLPPLLALLALGLAFFTLTQLQATAAAIVPTAVLTDAPCLNGRSAATYPCQNIDLLAYLPLSELNSAAANDIWGWTDPATGQEYALLGLEDGTAFVDITEPTNPVYLGTLPTHNGTAPQRDLKVYANYVYIVAEAFAHGMQVFDLTQLRQGISPSGLFSETAHYDQIGRSHNIAINEATGFAYIVGAQDGSEACNSGLHMVNLAQPAQPIFAGCFADDGYTHDTQCVLYHGPDAAYQGRELCFNANEDTLTIVDVTNKTAPVMVARTSYSGASYSHQGWLTADHRLFLLGDESDERVYGHNTRTYIWDIGQLADPQMVNIYTSNNPAIDHNLYLHEGYVYEANYRSGLRLLTFTGENPTALREVGYFDIFPSDNFPGFNGAWSSYPFFASGTVIVSGREQGLFVLRVRREGAFGSPSQQTALPGQPMTHTFTLTQTGLGQTYTLSLAGNNWPTWLPTNIVTAEADSQITISVVVQASAEVGATDGFTLTAVSPTYPPLIITGTTTTRVQPAVTLSPTVSTQNDRLGDTITHTFTLTNSGDYSDTFALTITGNGWASSVAAETAVLAPQQTATIPIAVQIPPNLSQQRNLIPIAHDTLTLTATSGHETAVFAQAQATTYAQVQPGLQTSGNASQTAPPHTTLSYQIAITNTGDYPDSYDIGISGNQWTTYSDNDEVGPLAVAGRGYVVVTVQTAVSGHDTALVTIHSRLDETVLAEVQLQTLVRSMIYLPLLRR